MSGPWMNLFSHPRLRRWFWPGLVMLIASPVVLYFVLRHTGISAVLAAGVFLVMLAKHLALVAGVLGPARVLRRRARRTANGNSPQTPGHDEAQVSDSGNSAES